MENIHESDSSKPCVYVVEASAGSGKTYALAKHYLNILFNKESHPKQIENILAITFTNKAANEMKERIFEFLKKIALDKFSSPDEEKNLLEDNSLDKKDRQIKAQNILDYIINNYNFFQIQTIDSFVNRILTSSAFRLGLPSTFEIRDDYSYFLLYSLDECIDKANHNFSLQKLFEIFLHQYIYLENTTGWMPKTNIQNSIESLYTHKNIYGFQPTKFNLKGENILISKRHLLKLYRELYERLPEKIHGGFRNTLSNFIEKNTECFDFKDIADSKNLTKDELPVKKDIRIPLELDTLWRQIRKETNTLAEREALSLFNCYIDIFNMVYGIFRDYANKNDILFLEELNQLAHNLINENGVTVPEFYYMLSTRIRHLLIDEFQDTSILQWQNLFPMTEEILSTGGSLFYVGDKKQAIFRFRGGEVGLFDKIKEDFKPYIKENILISNYRSQKEIVKFNNAVFDKENLRRFLLIQQENADDDLRILSENDINEITSIFSDSKQKYERDGGYVRVEAIDCPNKDEKDEIIKDKLLRFIGELKNRSNLKDIAILCRENEEVELVSNWLIEKGVPVESEKTLNIKINPYISEIISFLKFLNSPIDNLSFASFIMGDIFTQSTGIGKTEIQDFLFKLRNEKDFYIYREFKNIYPDIWGSYIENFFKTVGFVELYEFVIDIYKKFEVLKNFPEQQGFFMHFLQLIKENEDEHYGITDFLEFFEKLSNTKLFVKAKDIDAIKVLTIHKAKGLGFGTVIIPFLEFDKNSLRMNKRGETDIQEKNLFVRLDKKYAKLSSRVASVYMDEYKKTFIDGLNTIYVALTRAKNELYVFIPYGMARTNNIAQYLIPQNIFECGSIQKYSTEPKVEESITLPPSEYKEWIGFLKDEFSDLNKIKNREKILKGKILHEILSSIENLTETDKEIVIEKGISKAKTFYPNIPDFSEFRLIINRLLEVPELKKFFYVSDGEIYLEKDIVNRFGDTKRIDRLIIKQNEVWIVEYKTTGESTTNYKEQIRNYIDLIKELCPAKTVKGFAIFLEEARVEEILF